MFILSTVVFCTVWFTFVSASGGSHSLWVFATYINGQLPFPEFSAVTMVDDIAVGHYNSRDMRMELRGLKRSDIIGNTSSQDAATEFERMYHAMKKKARYLKTHFNHTTGVGVVQRLVGCELRGDQPGPMMTKEAFNGYGGFERYYDPGQDTQKTEWKWAVMKTPRQLQFDELFYAYVYHPKCIRMLKEYLKETKNRVFGKVKPRVRLFQKTLPNSEGAKLTCLATGFYPRHINLTLLRDGQPVPDHQITGGELLPNGDETYQMRKSLEVKAEELGHHNYTCTAEHLSLDNKLDIDFAEDTGPGHMSIITSVLVVSALCAIGAGLIIWKKTCAGQGSQSSPQSTSNSTTRPTSDARQRAQDRPSSDQSEISLRRLES